MYSLQPKHGKQEKVCQFINCSLSISSTMTEKQNGAGKENIAVINIENDDYDSDQDQ